MFALLKPHWPEKGHKN